MTAAHQPAHADADTRGLGLSIHVPPSAIQQRRLVYHASALPSPATFGLGFGPCSSYHGGPQRVLHRVSGLVAPACSPTWCPDDEFRVHGNMDREGIRALKMSPTSAAARGLFHAFICLYCSGSISASCGFKADAPSPRTTHLGLLRCQQTLFFLLCHAIRMCVPVSAKRRLLSAKHVDRAKIGLHSKKNSG